MDKQENALDLMRYDLRIQEALRGAVRSIMSDVARTGLPGDHHFYISFRTRARGVQMSERLLKQYPDEMTIVLQHQFWDLVVSERDFSVGLSFKQIPEKLVVPYEAITSFVDPTVHFALKFEPAAEAEETTDAPAAIRPAAPPPIASLDRDEPLQDRKGQQPRRLTPKAGPSPEAARAADKPSKETSKRLSAPDEEVGQGAGQGVDKEAGKIVSIDAFRKKT